MRMSPCSERDGLVMKKTEQKPTSLLADVGDISRPLRVRSVRVMGREWWAINPDDTWPGMVMDLRRLGFESMAWGEEVLVREGAPLYETQMEGPNAPTGLRPFPVYHPTIQIRRESYAASFSTWSYSDDDDEEELGEDGQLESEDLQYE